MVRGNVDQIGACRERVEESCADVGNSLAREREHDDLIGAERACLHGTDDAATEELGLPRARAAYDDLRATGEGDVFLPRVRVDASLVLNHRMRTRLSVRSPMPDTACP